MKPHVFEIPASTSNLGAGFDALGLALGRHLRVTIEGAREFSVQARGTSAESIPTGPDNLIFHVARTVAAERAWSLPCFRMAIDNEIPLCRGLGSSAAAIIAGITCYEMATGDRLSDSEIFQYALQFESHPDNLAAALYGGFVVSAVSSAGSVSTVKLDVAPGATPVVVIPEFELHTKRARDVLPEHYSRSDTVYNVQRSALTVAALSTGKWSLLREAMRDRVHQLYRAPLIPGLEEILELSIPGLIGIALSGAGPTVFALAEQDRSESIGRTISGIFGKHGVRSAAHTLDIDTKGRVITAVW